MRPSADSSPPVAHSLPPRSEFDEAGYLRLHHDVEAAVRAGKIESGWHHFERHGFAEGRRWIPAPAGPSGAGSAGSPAIAAVPGPRGVVIREIAAGDEMFAGNEAHYFGVGESALNCVETALFSVRLDRSGIRKILDLPCGHGRVMRYLRAAFPEAELTACDLNRDGVDFCARVFGAVPVVSEVEVADIPLGGEFDLIWCGSLLTHLPAAKCAAFLQWFRERLRTQGLLVFSTHGRDCSIEIATGSNACGLSDRQAAELLAEYRRTGFGYVDYAPGAGYGISVATPDYLMANFIQNTDWRLLGYQERGWDGRQDVICLQKRPDGEIRRGLPEVAERASRDGRHG